MELAVQFLLVLALLSSLFQMSHWSWTVRVIAALTLALFAYLLYPWVIEQSKDQLNVWMSNPIIMQNLAVIQVIEAILFIIIDLGLTKQFFGRPAKKYYLWASFFPGIMLLAGVLYIQMICFYTFSSLDFDTLGMIFSISLGGIFLILPAIIRWVVPEDYLRMELRYILSFGQLLGGVVITVFCQGLPYSQHHLQFEFGPLLIVVGLFMTSALIGWLWHKRPTKAN